ncbi:MAG: flagellar hook-length control protein FliK [Thiohalomonadaceae bacterium]
MQIAQPPQGISLSLTTTNLANSQQWQDGQIVNAKVLDVQKDGQLLLQLDGQNKSIQAQSPLPLAAGQQLKLIVNIEANRIVLRLLDNPVEETIMQQAWRTALPRQQPLVAVLQQIVNLIKNTSTLPDHVSTNPKATTSTNHTATASSASTSTSPTATANRIDSATAQLQSASPANLQTAAAQIAATPAPSSNLSAGDQLRNLATELLLRLAEPQRLTTADGLRQAISQSGLFLEARLAQGDTSTLSQDFRASLLRLLSLVKGQQAPAPAATQATSNPQPTLNQTAMLELGQQLEGALARLKVNQLQTWQAQQTSNDPAWLLELPVRHGNEFDVLRMRIQRDSNNGQDKGKPAWSVRLHFDSEKYGPVDSIITLLAGKVGVSFWAGQADTAARFQQHLEALRSQMQQAGLEVEHLRSMTGQARLDDEQPHGGLLNLSV